MAIVLQVYKRNSFNSVTGLRWKNSNEHLDLQLSFSKLKSIESIEFVEKLF